MIKKLSVERDLKRAQHTKAVTELEKRQAAGKAAQDAADHEASAAAQEASAANGAAGEGSGGAVAGGDRMDES